MMRVTDLIAKKRDGQALTSAELRFLIDGYTAGEIPDYQMSAWAMAVYFQGMDEEETAALTLAMAESGDRIDLSSIPGIKVDKHSTGGVGDTTTIVLAPLVASVGVPVAKMSGRGLGHTGGTLDKLEAIPGFNVEMDDDDFLAQVKTMGVALAGQTVQIAPADKKLYALRDVTATVHSMPLIASSIMSKKIASGADAIVLDVKTGDGAFMKTEEDAILLAQTMVQVGRLAERETVALITSMREPLGFAVGNALEIKEAIAVLKGEEEPADLREICLRLGTEMVLAGGISDSEKEARRMLEHAISSGKALQKWKEWIAAQGGDERVVEDISRLPQASDIMNVAAEHNGYITDVQAERIGSAAMKLGAGRQKTDDRIDPSVGVIVRKKIGEHVRQGDVLAELHCQANESANVKQQIAEEIREAFHIQTSPPKLPVKQVLARVTTSGVERY